jgi:hypothetical protein
MGSRLWRTDWVLLVARWIARIVSTFALMVAIVFVVGEGLPNLAELPLADLLLTLVFLAMLVGVVLGWRWEAAGGVVALVGFAAFLGLEYVALGSASVNGFLALFPIAGVLYLFCWWRRKRITPAR